jgi:nicotinamide-nucleotide amidase
VTVAAFIHVGDELLTGRIDPYPKGMLEQMRRRGSSIASVTMVRDDVREIVSAFRFALSLSPDIVVVTGGLGPTLDDVTREALAELMGVELIVSEDAAGWMDEALARMHGRPGRSGIRLRMARVPRGATALRNIAGAACGVRATVDGVTFFLLPGFPEESMPMFEAYVLPLADSDGMEELETKVWKGESSLEPIFQKVVSRFQVRIASLPASDWKERGNSVVIKGPKDEVIKAMEFFKDEVGKLGPDVSCQ